MSSDPLDLSALERPTGEARGLPAAAYRDAAVFEAERERVFARGWAAICAEADVAEPGSWFPETSFGVPILVTRDRAGEVRAFHNVCRHRGVTLAERPGRGPLITCPYHAWAYGHDGALVATPHIGGEGVHELADFERGRCGLSPIRTGVWAGFVFVNLSGRAAPLERYLAPLIARWSGIDLAAFAHGSVMDFAVEANWKLAIENSADFYHLPWVHPNLQSYSAMGAHYFANAGGVFFGTASRVYQAEAHDGARLPEAPGVDDEWRMRAEYPTIFPTLMFGLMADHVYGVVVLPDGPMRTRERFHLFHVGAAASDPAHAAAREKIAARWREINEEDLAIVARLQRGRASPGFDGGRLAPGQDFANHRFMRVVAAHLKAGPEEDPWALLGEGDGSDVEV